MANSKISALTAVTTPTAASEFAVNEGGTSKKMTLTQVYEVPASTQVLMDNGTVGAPGLAFNGDPDTGFYRIGANRIGVSIAGADQFQFTATRFEAANANGPQLINAAPSATAASFRPNKVDDNTGIGSNTVALKICI